MELRKDYFLDRWVIVGTGRGKRPHQFKQESDLTSAKLDVFAQGNEHLTPPEIGRKGSPWKMRWFDNKFPFLSPNEKIMVPKKGSFSSIPAYGYHQILVETRSKKQLWDLPPSDFEMLLEVYAEMIDALLKKKGIKYVQVFKNHGKRGGTSIVHSHSQIAGCPIIPPEVMQKIKVSNKLGNGCYKKIIKVESKGPRAVFETKHALAFTPFASRFNFEVWVFPKRYVSHPGKLTAAERKSIAGMLNKILRKLKKLNAPYNMLLYYAPKGKDLHMHFEITPRMQTWAGFEISSGIIINEVMPEDAASFYRN